MGKEQVNPICRRVSEVRLETCGPRGKARFAKQLGISPSTYDYYESARVPPADILVTIADVGGVDLRWLLTGESRDGLSVAANHPAVRRAAELIGDHPSAAGPLLAFLDILAETLRFPSKEPAGQSRPIPPPPTAPVSQSTTPPQSDARRNWIPILGRTAAGVPRFWSPEEDATGLTTLADLIARCTESPAGPEAVQPARAVAGPSATAQAVQIITLRRPLPWGSQEQGSEVAQFIAASAIKAAYPDAFALRIDGDSMSPEIRHGELVVLSASAPAVAGQPAVVQLNDAVGVTCKLYHPSGKQVNLVPINEKTPPTTVDAGQIEWALRVLARIHPNAGK